MITAAASAILPNRGEKAVKIEDESDTILARVLGDNLQTATLRMILYVAAIAALLAALVTLLGI